MITCPQCGASNLPGMAYCENCGAPLPQETAPAAVSAAPAAAVPPDQAALPADQPAAPPDTSAPAPAAVGANIVAADVDTAAPAPVAPAAVAAPPPDQVAPPADQAPASALPVDQTPPAPAPTTVGATLSIAFPSGQVFTMQGDTIDVGRADVAQGWHPELDVIPYGGGSPDLGVSRHQARITRQDGSFAVIDVGSTNGTYVNGRAAPYNQPVALHDGDTLSFGALNTQVTIK